MNWHGYPSDFDTFLSQPALDRFYDTDALNWLIDQESTRPADYR